MESIQRIHPIRREDTPSHGEFKTTEFKTTDREEKSGMKNWA